MVSPTETEVKIKLSDSLAILERLERAGFTLSSPRQFESNTIYDSPDHKLRQAEMIIRLRRAGDKFVLTWKGPSEGGKYKIRPEIETAVGSLEAAHNILRKVGFEPVFHYEKYRCEFTHKENSSGVVTYDETPIGNFLELEGPGEWIDETASRLGFSENDHVLESYGRLYKAYCEQNHVDVRNMVFTS